MRYVSRAAMSRAGVALACLWALPGLVAAAGATAPKAPPLDFERDVRPILSRHCFKCHGQDDKGRMAELRLDTRAGATTALPDGHRAVVPGKPALSAAINRIFAPGAAIMPPAVAQSPLNAAEKLTLKRWVAAGAEYREHWSFVAPKLPALPAVKNVAWCRNPIDRFVLTRLERAGLKPSPPADRFTLLRRVSLDLRGLPPTPQEVEEYARDRSPDAYEKMVDRFLADPAYGERWARMWLDLARYADSAGYGSDPLRTIWAYRDWVIDAYNRDLPYDQFTIDQLAGDLLPNPTLEQRIATAFNRNTMTNTEGGTDREEFRVAAIKDRVDTTMQVWMGLTMGCAKCHSHKFDPISQTEYYQFYALFNQSADNDQPNESPTIEVPDESVAAKNREIDGKVKALQGELAASPAEPKAKSLKTEIAALEKSRPAAPTVPVMVELPENRHRVTHLLIKSNFLDPGEKVEPAVPRAFHAFPSGAPLNRLGVAKWLVDPTNPLTARVAANRYWARLFGTGIVETEEDFGTQGDLPTHPELLDWLALTFQSPAASPGSDAAVTLPPSEPPSSFRLHPSSFGCGWSMKKLVRLMVTSSTYRQSSRVTPALLAKDPSNRLLSRGPRYRLEAEMVRDQALALSGLLSRKMHGPSVFPPQPPGLWQAAFNGQRTWATSTGEDRYRRGLYTFWRRTTPYPSMTTFDAPSREFCVVRRIRTNTPLQAFVTLNDPVYVEAAQALARRLVKEGGATPEERVQYGLALCLCRPRETELASPGASALLSLYREQLEHYRTHADDAAALATDGSAPLKAGQDPAEMAAWTVVANVLLNMDRVLTKG